MHLLEDLYVMKVFFMMHEPISIILTRQYYIYFNKVIRVEKSLIGRNSNKKHLYLLPAEVVHKTIIRMHVYVASFHLGPAEVCMFSYLDNE